MHKYRKEEEKCLLDYIGKNEEEIFETQGGKNWISNVACLTMNILKKYRHKNWQWLALSQNLAISKQEKIATKGEFPWLWEEIIETMDDYVQCNVKFDIGHPFYHKFSKKNKNICRDVEEYPDFLWDWRAICLNTNITESFISKHLDKLEDDIFKTYLSFNKNLSIDFLLSNQVPNEKIANNPNLNEKNLHIYLSKKLINSTRKIQDALTENMAIDFILSHPEYNWNYELIQFRDDITSDDIVKFSDFFHRNGHMHIISSCSNVDKKFLQTYAHTNLDYFYRWHSGLTIKEVLHLPLEKIFLNKLEGTREEKLKFLREYYAVRKIEKAFLTCYWSLEYAWGRRRLEKEYDSLFLDQTVKEKM